MSADSPLKTSQSCGNVIHKTTLRRRLCTPSSPLHGKTERCWDQGRVQQVFEPSRMYLYLARSLQLRLLADMLNVVFWVPIYQLIQGGEKKLALLKCTDMSHDFLELQILAMIRHCAQTSYASYLRLGRNFLTAITTHRLSEQQNYSVWQMSTRQIQSWTRYCAQNVFTRPRIIFATKNAKVCHFYKFTQYQYLCSMQCSCFKHCACLLGLKY